MKHLPTGSSRPAAEVMTGALYPRAMPPQRSRSRIRRRDAVRNEAQVRDAARAVFNRRGPALTMDDVAAEAGVSKGTVYNTFGTRDELIDAMTIAVLQDATHAYAAAAQSDDPWQAFHDAIVTPTIGVGGRPEVMDPNAPDSPVKDAYTESRDALDALLDRLKQSRHVRPEITVSQLSVLFRGLYLALGPYDERTVAETASYAEILLRGIRT